MKDLLARTLNDKRAKMQAGFDMDYFNDFPTIMQLIGKNWFVSELGKEFKHPLVFWISQGRPNWTKINSLKKGLKEKEEKAALMIIIDRLQRHHYTLAHLERCLKILKEEPKIRRILNHLKSEGAFWSGYSEAEVACGLKMKFDEIELEPELPNRKYADVKFKMEDKWVFGEVTTPKEGQKFKEIMEKAMAEKRAVEVPSSVGRARRKISEEYNHFRNIMDDIPAILFINTNQCEYDKLEIEDALKGIPKYEIKVNKETGETSESWIREPWTVFEEDKEVELLSAIVSYKGDFDINGKLFFERNIFYSFSQEEAKRVNEIFDFYK